MLFTTFKAGANEYKLRLTASAMFEVEKKLGENPLNFFINISDSQVPKMSTMITVLWGAMQKFQHGITMEAACDIYDEFIDDGNTMMDLIPILIELLKASGFMTAETEDAPEDENEKNE